MLKNKKLSFLNGYIQNIYGLGKNNSCKIFKDLGLNSRLQVSALKRKQMNELTKKTQKIVSGKKLKDQIKNTISFLSKNKTYIGTRHKLKYPARGQRTHTNAKTKKKFKY